MPGSVELDYLGVKEKIFCFRYDSEKDYIEELVGCINDDPKQKYKDKNPLTITPEDLSAIAEYQTKLTNILNSNSGYFTPGPNDAFIIGSEVFEQIVEYDGKTITPLIIFFENFVNSSTL